MNFTVVDIHLVNKYIKNLIEYEDEFSNKKIGSWLTKAITKECIENIEWVEEIDIRNPMDWLEQNLKTKLRIPQKNWEHIKKALENKEKIYQVKNLTHHLRSEIDFVLDWLAELEQRDARLFSKLDRITWKQAVEHSRRWHEALARKAEKLKSETIPFDENCPVVLECDDGLKWVWLKTDKARDDEGRIMGHCVGNGGYDDLAGDEDVFSLRDAEGHPHVTVELDRMEVVQAMMKGNTELSKKYEDHVEVLRKKIGLKLWMLNNPTEDFNTDESGYVHLTFNQITPKNVTFYIEEGLFHSKDGNPSVEWEDGYKEWYRHGQRHREDGPAIVKPNGDEEWWINGSRHREDGPAVIYEIGIREWYEHGIKTKTESTVKGRGDREAYFDTSGRYHRTDGPARIYENGMEEWYLNGKLHRTDGPAVTINDEYEAWYEHGELHRENDPAIIKKDGTREWWHHGQRHREGGPAITYCKDKSLLKIHEIDMTWDVDIDAAWYSNGKLHRKDGPAVIRSNGNKEWYLNGKLHREDGPAVIDDEYEAWYEHGELLQNKKIGDSYKN